MRGLVMEYRTRAGRIRSLDGVGFHMDPGEIVGLVGESGSGKSSLAAALGRLPVPGANRLSGELLIEGREVACLGEAELMALRRSSIGYVFQDPVATLDPTMKIGRQVALAIGTDRRGAAAAIDGLGFADPARVLESYPHQLSGGMAQRVAMGIVLARRPRLIVADEPTAALDASVKTQILDLLVGNCRRLSTALLLVTHDLHSVRRHADRVLVMYAGRIIEEGFTAEVLSRPAHPYTAALLRSAVGRERAGERVDPIPGLPPQFAERQEFCAFSPRCRHATERCRTVRPEGAAGVPNAVCHYAGEIIP